MKLTVEKIMSWSPCSEYTESKVKELIGKGKTPLEIGDLAISAEDRLWVVLRPEIIAENDLHELACKFAEQALRAERKAGREPHPDSWKAIKVKRQWLKKNATDEQLYDAMLAAELAVMSSERTSAMLAAESSAMSSARSSAMSCAELAARNKQINIVKKYLYDKAVKTI